ncbi:MAG: hypothetical protein AB1489_11710 [Acidobacteriota bacterium]
MNEQALLEKIRRLPPDKQEEVEHFVNDIEQRASKQPRRKLMGSLAHLNVHITKEEIDEVRREMWSNFPRDIE